MENKIEEVILAHEKETEEIWLKALLKELESAEIVGGPI